MQGGCNSQRGQPANSQRWLMCPLPPEALLQVVQETNEWPGLGTQQPCSFPPS